MTSPTSSEQQLLLPTTMRAWTHRAKAQPTLESVLELTEGLPLPFHSPSLKPGEVLVQVRAAGLNPADHKAPEAASVLLPGSWLWENLYVAMRGKGSSSSGKGVVPAMDFAGEVVGLGAREQGEDEERRRLGKIELGAPVVGRTMKGTLAEYVVVGYGDLVRIPEVEEGGKKKLLLTMEEAASLPTAGLTAYQTLVPYLLGTYAESKETKTKNKASSWSAEQIRDAGERNRKSGDKLVLVNGASGGVGSLCVQIAANGMGCKVTGVCSGRNEEFVRELGADEVLDYTKGDLLATLREKHGGDKKFAWVVDNVGSPKGMVREADKWTEEKCKIIQIGAGFGLGDIVEMLKRSLLPSWLGGGSRGWEFILTRNSVEDLEQLVQWTGEGKVKPIVAHTFGFGEVREAFAQLRTQRTTGKVVVKVGEITNAT